MNMFSQFLMSLNGRARLLTDATQDDSPDLAAGPAVLASAIVRC